MNKKFIANFAFSLVFAFSFLQAEGLAQNLTKLTETDIQLLLKDENPAALKQFVDDFESRRKILESLRLALALASQAVRSGLADDSEVREELESIRSETIAFNYDRKKNADKGPMPQFSLISEDQVEAFYKQPGNDEKFKTFLDRKIDRAKKDGTLTKDREPTSEELASVREYYAKIRIYAKEAADKKDELGDEYNYKIELKVKLQQAQYLARLYTEKVLNEKIKVLDGEILSYIARHPEFDISAKKDKALKILQRVKSGEDFAKLAREFSEDPGSQKAGGLYVNVKNGQFLPEFENAALALKPGQINSDLVETKFGFHIIKLEAKGIGTYNVRHILISTTVIDPLNPLSSTPLKDKVRSILEEEKEQQILNEIIAENPIDLPEDFTVSPPSAHQPEPVKKQQEKQLLQQKVSSRPRPKGKKQNNPRRKKQPR